MWLPLAQELSGLIFRGNKAFEGLSQKKSTPSQRLLNVYLLSASPRAFMFPVGATFFGAPHMVAALRFSHIFSLYHFFNQFVNGQVAQTFSRNFVQLAYCFFCWLVVYYYHSQGERSTKNLEKIFQQSLKNPLTKSKRCDIISTSNKGKR